MRGPRADPPPASPPASARPDSPYGGRLPSRCQSQSRATPRAGRRLAAGRPSGIEQPAQPAELEPRPGSRRLAAQLAAVRDLERDVTVADEDERRLGQRECVRRALVREHVVPDRVARAAVEELGVRRGRLRLERGKGTRALSSRTVCVQRAAAAASPANASIGIFPPTRSWLPARQIVARPCRSCAVVRLRPVADNVTQAPDPVEAAGVDLGQHGLGARRFAWTSEKTAMRTGCYELRGGASGRSWIPRTGGVLRPGVLERIEQLLGELRRHVHARDDDPGNIAFRDLVIDPRERDRELVLGERDVGEVRVGSGEVFLVDLDVELPLLAGVVLVHARTVTA